MTYQKAIDFLYYELPVYQNSGISAYKPNLNNITKLCDNLDNPQNKFKSLHIAGTNGKGSTAHMLSSILQESGYKVGLHTSPHLVSFTERNKINGTEIPEAYVTKFVENNLSLIKKIKASFFEVVVALGFDYFANENVDIAIIETGLGGRLDATNIINPELSIITNIGLDHVNILGSTLEEIAEEKAGIIKPNTPVVIGDKRTELITKFKILASYKNAEVYLPPNLPKNFKLDLKGIYQKQNAAIALKAIEILNKKNFSITENKIFKGLNNVVKNTGLKGRWQVVHLKPYTVLDTAHNVSGFEEIKKQLENFKSLKKFFCLGFVNDKDVKEILNLLPKDGNYYFCEPNVPRALRIKNLKEFVPKELNANYFENLSSAYNEILSTTTSDDFIYIGGSNFIVGEYLKAYNNS